MNDQQLLRYARHLLLDGIEVAGQQRLLAAHVLVIGAGGLGCPAVMYLASAGVGHITVVDHDDVELSNLQRQIAHQHSRIGMAKAQSVQMTAAALNPDAQLRAVVRRADALLLDELVPQADVVLDCTDNFRTRHAVNAACVRHRKPLVWAAAVGWDAQASVYDPSRTDSPTDSPTAPPTAPPNGPPNGPPTDLPTDSPCYACIFPPDAGHEDVACSTMGVLAPLVGMIGSLQAVEALKLLVRSGGSLSGRLLMLDGRGMRWDEMKVLRQRQCSVCGTASVQR
jgi:molybdopterin-synthase adenylyltransferase